MVESSTDEELARARLDLEWHRRTLDAYEAAFRRRADSQSARSVNIKPKLAGSHDARTIAGSASSPDIDPAWPATSWPEVPITPSPGFACASLAGGSATVTAIAVFGRRGVELDEAILTVGQWQRRSMNFVPVFLTDSGSHQAFARRGYAFEYFPPATYRTLGGILDKDRIETRLRLVRRKWNITTSIDLSAPTDLPGLPTPGGATAATDNSKPGEPGGARLDETRGTGRQRSRYTQAEIKRLASMIRASGLFDTEWYLSTNPDVAKSGVDPIVHYLQSGAIEGRDPHPLFKTEYYARQMLGAGMKSRGKS